MDNTERTNIADMEGRKLDSREERLRQRREKLDALEAELREREKALKARDAKRKQIILRLPESLWADIAGWAEDDFRSVNAQIEYQIGRAHV